MQPVAAGVSKSRELLMGTHVPAAPMEDVTRDTPVAEANFVTAAAKFMLRAS